MQRLERIRKPRPPRSLRMRTTALEKPDAHQPFSQLLVREAKAFGGDTKGQSALPAAMVLGIVLVVSSASLSTAADPVTLENVVDPGPNKPDEPFAESFSLEKATHFLDSAAVNWQKRRKCFTCHTNFAYLYSRPSVSADDPAHETVRTFAEQLVTERWEKKGPRWDAEVVATAAALAFNDAA